MRASCGGWRNCLTAVAAMVEVLSQVEGRISSIHQLSAVVTAMRGIAIRIEGGEVFDSRHTDLPPSLETLGGSLGMGNV